jgi:hypothetical protein
MAYSLNKHKFNDALPSHPTLIFAVHAQQSSLQLYVLLQDGKPAHPFFVQFGALYLKINKFGVGKKD